MKQHEILLKNMSDIIEFCIILFNMCIVNNESTEEDLIFIEKSKLTRTIIKGKTGEDSEL